MMIGRRMNIPSYDWLDIYRQFFVSWPESLFCGNLVIVSAQGKGALGSLLMRYSLSAGGELICLKERPPVSRGFMFVFWG